MPGPTARRQPRLAGSVCTGETVLLCAGYTADNVVNESVKEKLEIFQRENQYLHDQIKIKDEQIASLLALLTNKPKEV